MTPNPQDSAVALEVELLPCPFCGDFGAEENESSLFNMQGSFKRAVYCHSCFAEGPPAETSKEAIEHWNTRASQSDGTSGGWQTVPTTPTKEMIEAAMHVKRVRLLEVVAQIRAGVDETEARTPAVVAEWEAMLVAAQTKERTMSDDNKEGAGVPVAYLLTRPSGFAWPLMPKDITPETRAVFEADGARVEPLFLATPPAVMPAAPSDAQIAELRARKAYAIGPAGYIDFARDVLALSQTMQPQAGPSIFIDFKQATDLLAMFGGEPNEITLQVGEGHSGRGMYASYTDMPEEGTIFLGVSDQEAMPEPQAEPAAGEQAGAVARDAAIELVSFYRKAVIEALGGGAEEVATMHAEQRRLVNALAAPGAAIAAREQEAEAFLRQMASLPGTIIRSSRDLSPQAISNARASSKWLALRDGLGFAILAEHARQAAEDEQSSCEKCSSPNDCQRLGCAASASSGAARGAVPYPMIPPNYLHKDGLLWELVGDHQRAVTALERDYSARMLDRHVENMMRAYVDADRAALTQPTTVQQAEVADLREGLGQIAAAVKDNPVMLRCCRLIDERLALKGMQPGERKEGA